MQDAVYPSLKGRAVLVSGGAGGIGAAIVARFCAQESLVVFLDRDAAAGARLSDILVSPSGRRPHFIACDLTDVEALQHAASKAAELVGPISVLVNNAGQDDRHRFEEVSVAYWDERIATNLRHQFFLAQAVAPGMRTQKQGSIINLGSIAPATRTADAPVYVTVKAAAHGLTRALARDLGGDGIRVNTVIPGLTMTDKWAAIIAQRPGGSDDVLRQQCLKQLLVPDDVARLVLWLAADDSRMSTAHEYHVDAGRT